MELGGSRSGRAGGSSGASGGMVILDGVLCGRPFQRSRPSSPHPHGVSVSAASDPTTGRPGQLAVMGKCHGIQRHEVAHRPALIPSQSMQQSGGESIDGDVESASAHSSHSDSERSLSAGSRQHRSGLASATEDEDSGSDQVSQRRPQRRGGSHGSPQLRVELAGPSRHMPLGLHGPELEGVSRESRHSVAGSSRAAAGSAPARSRTGSKASESSSSGSSVGSSGSDVHMLTSGRAGRAPSRSIGTASEPMVALVQEIHGTRSDHSAQKIVHRSRSLPESDVGELSESSSAGLAEVREALNRDSLYRRPNSANMHVAVSAGVSEQESSASSADSSNSSRASEGRAARTACNPKYARRRIRLGSQSSGRLQTRTRRRARNSGLVTRLVSSRKVIQRDAHGSGAQSDSAGDDEDSSSKRSSLLDRPSASVVVVPGSATASVVSETSHSDGLAHGRGKRCAEIV